MKNIYKAFTLIELIITIVILSILSTIAFLSFSSYSSSSRDSVRLSDISNIAKGLVVQYSIGGSYIIPDNSIYIYSGSNTIIGYQGKVGSNTINTIKLSNNNNSGKDPLDNTYYTYNINYNKSKYQVTGYLESKGNVINRVGYEDDLYESDLYDSGNSAFLSSSFGAEGNGVEESINKIKCLLNTRKIPGSSPRMTNYLKDISTTLRSAQYDDNGGLINQTYSTNYTNRYPYTKGDSIGVILSSTGGTGSIIYTPLEDSGTGIDISSGTLTSGKVVINNNTDSSTGVSVVSMSGYVNSVSSNTSGTCGSNNGQILTSAPSTNLCSIGTPSSVLYSTGIGQYNRTCGSTNCNAYDNKTVLLLHFDGNANNYGSNVSSITNNGSVTFSSSGVFSNSAYFNGANYLNIAASSDFALGTNDYTIDFLVKSTQSSGVFPSLLTYRYSSQSYYGIHFTSGNMYYWNGSSPLVGISSSISVTDNIWHHIAIVRYSGTLTIYIDGNNRGSMNMTNDILNSGQEMLIGCDWPGYNTYFVGYIDELRISKGIARWTSTFTPPNIPY